MTDSDGKLVVISGPSGVGKSTIAREALRRTGATFSISATTRPPRAGEVDGRDYCFVTHEEFRRMIDAGELLEWAEVFGELYGTPAGPVREAIARGRTVLLDIDVQGGLQVHEKMPDAVGVLIVPPSDEELARRLRGRGSEDEQTVQRRLAAARKEIETATASGAYNHEVVNDELEAAIEQVADIIQREHSEK